MQYDYSTLLPVAAMPATTDEVILTARNIRRAAIVGAELAKCIRRLDSTGNWTDVRAGDWFYEFEREARVKACLYHRHGVLYLRSLEFDPDHVLDRTLNALFGLLDPLIEFVIELIHDAENKDKDIREEVDKVRRHYRMTIAKLVETLDERFFFIADFDDWRLPRLRPDTLLHDTWELCVDAIDVIKTHEPVWEALSSGLLDWGARAVVGTELVLPVDEVFRRLGDIEKSTWETFAHCLVHIMQSVGEYISF